MAAVRAVGTALKGPTTTQSGSGHRSVKHPAPAGPRPVRLHPPGAVAARRCRRSGPDVDLLVVRENTEDLYAGWETGPGEPGHPELAARVGLDAGREVSLKAISWAGSLRIARYAFA